MNVGDTCKYKVTPGYLLAKKISWFAFSGFKRDLLLVMMLPAVLNVLSEATLVADEHRYSFASWERRGIRVDSCFHHFNEVSSISITGI